MNKVILALTPLVLFVFGASYYYFFYPPAVFKRYAQHSLDEMSAAFASKDSKQIDAMLEKLITDGGQVDLEVKIYSISQMNGSAPQKESFDKPNFIHFVDTILYSLDDYRFNAEIKEFSLSSDHHSANVTLATQAWGDGMSYYGGVGVHMRFNTQSTCEGTVLFSGKTALLDKIHCTVELATLPKPGEESKLANPDTMQGLLR